MRQSPGRERSRRGGEHGRHWVAALGGAPKLSRSQLCRETRRAQRAAGGAGESRRPLKRYRCITAATPDGSYRQRFGELIAAAGAAPGGGAGDRGGARKAFVREVLSHAIGGMRAQVEAA